MYGFPPHLAAYLLGLELIEFLGHIHGYQVPEGSEAERIIDDVGQMLEVLDRLQRSRSARRLPAARARVARARQRFLDIELPERHKSFALGKLDLILHELRSSAMATA